jgi:hypothetical protein
MSESPENPTLESLYHNPNGELQQIKVVWGWEDADGELL